MPQSALDICNSALTKIGGRTIESFGDVSTKEGVLVNARFQPILETMCRNHVWSFLKEITTLTSTTATTLDPWLWIHTLPTDLARLLSVKYNGYDIDTELTSDGLYTCYDVIDIRYVKRIDPASFTTIPPYEFIDDFAEVVAYALAVDIVISLTRDADLKKDIYAQYNRALQDARFNGACERSEYKTTADEWMNARNTPNALNPYPDKLH